jgi:hypothetical protein
MSSSSTQRKWGPNKAPHKNKPQAPNRRKFVDDRDFVIPLGQVDLDEIKAENDGCIPCSVDYDSYISAAPGMSFENYKRTLFGLKPLKKLEADKYWV